MYFPSTQTALSFFATVALTGAAFAQCPEETLQGNDTGPDDHFGKSMAAAGPRLLIGASEDDDQGGFSGSAYVFRYDTNAFVQEAKLIGSSVNLGDQFGHSVAMSSLGAFVGAPYGDGHGTGSGSVYGFLRNGTNWTQTTFLDPGEGDQGDRFGWSVALDGNFAVVGAPWADTTTGGVDGGAAYVFELVAGIGWQLDTKLIPNDINSQVQYGYSVAIDGNRIVVGAPRDNDGGFDAGAAYVFERAGGNWISSIKLINTDFEPTALFGWSVDVDGNEVMVGAPTMTGSGPNTGAAYIYSVVGTTWSEDAKLVDPDGGAFDRFGQSVSMDSGLAVVGAPFYQPAIQVFGRAFECRKEAGVWSVAFDISSGGAGLADRNFGTAVLATPGGAAVSDPLGPQNSVYLYTVGEPDCNANGFPDYCDISLGGSVDNNNNGVPDECEQCSIVNVCSSGPNSTGSPAVMTAGGSVSVSANDLELKASPVPNQPGIFFYGPASNSVPFGNGTLCVAAPIQRLSIVQASQNTFFFALDNTSPPNPSGQITPFSTWYFQCWFRDPASSGPSTFDLSDSLEISFCP